MVDDRRAKVLRNGANVWIVIPSELPYSSSGVLYGASPDEFRMSSEELLRALPEPAPPVTVKTTVTRGPLNVRSGPGTRYDRVMVNDKPWQLATGTAITLEQPATITNDGNVTLHWHKLSEVNGWVAGEYTGLYSAPIPTPPPVPPVPPAQPSRGAARFGMNFVGPGSPVSLFRLQALMDANGNRLGPTVVINEWKALDGLRADVIVYRVKTGVGRAEPDPFDYNGRYWSPAEWFDHWFPLLAQGARPGVFVKFHNELYWRGQWQKRITWERAFIALCNERRVKIAYGNFSVEHLESGALDALVPMARDGAAGGHILAFNTYWHTQRSEASADAGIAYMLPLIEKIGRGCPWAVLEYGFAEDDAKYQPGYLPTLLEKHKRIFANQPDYLGAALWCDASDVSDWKHSRIPEFDYPAIVDRQGKP